MSTESGAGLRRRQLLGAVGGTAVAGMVGAEPVLRAGAVRAWDQQVDVIVAGSGAAGMSAAIESAQAGARVMVLESLAEPGGSSVLSGGVVYAGGGTALQRALKVEDSAEAMLRFLTRAGAPRPPRDKIEQYCADSPEHFDWLVAQGIPYSQKLATAKGLPMGDESLYYSGDEQAWPARELATPAPRGHVPGVAGMNGGKVLWERLAARARGLGVQVRTRTDARRLVLENDGRVAGLVVQRDGNTVFLRARRGVVLACGGFIHNRAMVERYAPQLSRCPTPWAGAGDLGQGINMGIAAGAASLRMHEGFAIAPIYPPESAIAGILVNRAGQRFVTEDSYHGVIGHHVAYHQDGRAWLVTDSASHYAGVQDNFPRVAEASSIGALADALAMPRGSLQQTVGYYNRYAGRGEDPMFGKSPGYLRPLQGPPYMAWEISVERSFFPAHTFGGLATTLDGEVLDSANQVIPGLYAAGRNAASIPTAPYLASGLCVGDATYFGRRAGRAAMRAV